MRHMGTTFRSTLRAVADASDGLHIIFAANTLPHADVALRFAKQFVAGIEAAKISGNKIKFMNHGVIEFTLCDIYDQKK